MLQTTMVARSSLRLLCRPPAPTSQPLAMRLKLRANASTMAVDHLQSIKDATTQLKTPFWCAGHIASDGKPVSLCYPAASQEAKMESRKMPMTEENVEELKAACEQATFGKGSLEMLDPSYRRALALDTDKFLTSFTLSNYDILNTIKTVMMPDAASIRAEPYKLNVYRTGDFFKPHVDTPRGDGMFGSLVVCLPQPHDGGELVVRHKGTEATFDWAANSGDSLQWAAFYSDCEHEVFPVSSGNRITLTFNLYAAPFSNKEPYLPGLTMEETRIQATLAKALMSPAFMRDGGRLGIPCLHDYPIAHEKLFSTVPSTLKGSDALIYKALRHMGLNMEVKAVLDYTHEFKNAVEEDLYDLENNDNYEDEDEDEASEGSRLRLPLSDEDKEKHRAECAANCGNGLVLRNLQPFKGNSELACGEDPLFFLENGGGKDVTWVNQDFKYICQGVSEFFGNCPSPILHYAAAVLLADIPAWGSVDRQTLMKELGRVSSC